MRTLEFFTWMGPFKIPMVMVAIIILVLITTKLIDVFFRYKNSDIDIKKHLNSILFWGKFALVLGIFAQTIGIYNALKEIISAKDISIQIVMIGFKGSFTSTIFGFLLLILASLSWYFLKLRADKIS